jgi:hypothetical protein
MAKSRPSINQVIANPELLNHDGCWSFYDWFCKTSSLKNISMSFISKLKFLVNMGIIDGDNTYVWFKNNCPCVGNLYTDMRFSSLPTEEDEYGEFLGGIAPSLGFDSQKGQCKVWSCKLGLTEEDENGNRANDLTFSSWIDFKKQVESNPELLEKLRTFYRMKKES